MKVLPSACRKSVMTALVFWNVELKAACVLAETGDPTRSAATAKAAPSGAFRHELRIALSSPAAWGGGLRRRFSSALAPPPASLVTADRGVHPSEAPFTEPPIVAVSPHALGSRVVLTG